MIDRNIKSFVLDIVLKYNKMAFISGPRQTGKTTFAKSILKDFFQGKYFNWDIIEDQKKITHNPYFFQYENRDVRKKFLVVYDEIHKYSNWKNYLKGVYDGYSNEFSFLVTGSGRLDLFKKGGDSLFGRYLAIKLFPFSCGEILNTFPLWKDFEENLKNILDSKDSREYYEQIFKFSGFPEPCLRSSESFYNIWHNERRILLIREDIRNAYALKEISNIEILSNILAEKIGSPLSINSLIEDVKSSYNSIKNWLLILEQFYYFFRILPFYKSIARSLKKEPKIYLYDWAEIKDEGKRFENLVAFHLYKAVNLWKDTGQGDLNLFYIRDKEKREVDFLITEKNIPIFLIEAKINDEEISKNLLYFQKKLNIKTAIQVVDKKNVYKRINNDGFFIWVVSADKFFKILP